MAGTPGAGRGQCASAQGWRGRDVTVCDGERELGPVGPWYPESGRRGLHFTTMFGSSRGGVRGGQDQFSWGDVKTDKQRRTTWVSGAQGPGARGLWVRRAGCAEGLAFCSRRQLADGPGGPLARGRDLTWYAKGRANSAGLSGSRNWRL